MALQKSKNGFGRKRFQRVKWLFKKGKMALKKQISKGKNGFLKEKWLKRIKNGLQE